MNLWQRALFELCFWGLIAALIYITYLLVR